MIFNVNAINVVVNAIANVFVIDEMASADPVPAEAIGIL